MNGMDTRPAIERLASGLIAAARAARPFLVASPDAPGEALEILDAFLKAADPAGNGDA